MSYYAFTTEAADEYTKKYAAFVKKRDEIAAMLHEKYPMANRYHPRDDPEWREYAKQTAAFTKELEECMSPAANTFKSEVIGIASTLSSRLKADLIRETAELSKANGYQEMFIKNIVFGIYPHIDQSWYVYENGGKYYFKMKKTNKAFHEIEGVN